MGPEKLIDVQCFSNALRRRDKNSKGELDSRPITPNVTSEIKDESDRSGRSASGRRDSDKGNSGKDERMDPECPRTMNGACLVRRTSRTATFRGKTP